MTTPATQSATPSTPSTASAALPRTVEAALEAIPWARVDDHFIDGDWVRSTGSDRNPVHHPGTGEQWGEVPDATDEDLERAVTAAHRAFRGSGWAQLPAAERARLMLVMAERVEQKAELLALTNTLENGSPITETTGAAANAAGILRYFASLAEHLDTEDIRRFPHGTGETVVSRDPVGVCTLIAPWNFPINLMVAKLAPALLAGCTVVMKPASPTPLSIRFIVEAAAEAGIPDGVVNLVTGSGRRGDVLVRHPLVSKVGFTGSTPVGRRIAGACGELLRPVTLELGGKSSAVVLPDADLQAMSAVLLRSCLRNTGQTCYISTRILAPAERYEEVVAMVTETVAAAPQGNPLDPQTVFGPSATRSQFETVQEYLASAAQEGAVATTGGRTVDGPGWFVEPTVLRDVQPWMRVAREEIFGPVLTVLPYREVDEAVELANDTDFGLGGVVFSDDEDAALNVARRMDTGSVGINFFASNHAAPFGGRKDSGLGVEFGLEGLAAYVSYQSVHRR